MMILLILEPVTCGWIVMIVAWGLIIWTTIGLERKDKRDRARKEEYYRKQHTSPEDGGEV